MMRSSNGREQLTSALLSVIEPGDGFMMDVGVDQSEKKLKLFIGHLKHTGQCHDANVANIKSQLESILLTYIPSHEQLTIKEGLHQLISDCFSGSFNKSGRISSQSEEARRLLKDLFDRAAGISDSAAASLPDSINWIDAYCIIQNTHVYCSSLCEYAIALYDVFDLVNRNQVNQVVSEANDQLRRQDELTEEQQELESAREAMPHVSDTSFSSGKLRIWALKKINSRHQKTVSKRNEALTKLAGKWRESLSENSAKQLLHVLIGVVKSIFSGPLGYLDHLAYDLHTFKDLDVFIKRIKAAHNLYEVLFDQHEEESGASLEPLTLKAWFKTHCLSGMNGWFEVHDDGTTLFPLVLRSGQAELVTQFHQSFPQANIRPILPYLLKLRMPWHSLHAVCQQALFAQLPKKKSEVGSDICPRMLDFFFQHDSTVSSLINVSVVRRKSSHHQGLLDHAGAAKESTDSDSGEEDESKGHVGTLRVSQVKVSPDDKETALNQLHQACVENNFNYIFQSLEDDGRVDLFLLQNKQGYTAVDLLVLSESFYLWPLFKASEQLQSFKDIEGDDVSMILDAPVDMNFKKKLKTQDFSADKKQTGYLNHSIREFFCPGRGRSIREYEGFFNFILSLKQSKDWNASNFFGSKKYNIYCKLIDRARACGAESILDCLGDEMPVFGVESRQGKEKSRVFSMKWKKKELTFLLTSEQGAKRKEVLTKLLDKLFESGSVSGLRLLMRSIPGNSKAEIKGIVEGQFSGESSAGRHYYRPYLCALLGIQYGEEAKSWPLFSQIDETVLPSAFGVPVSDDVDDCVADLPFLNELVQWFIGYMQGDTIQRNSQAPLSSQQQSGFCACLCRMLCCCLFKSRSFSDETDSPQPISAGTLEQALQPCQRTGDASLGGEACIQQGGVSQRQ
jgi:hypothetical protein